jgi:predicted amidohydrolase
VIDNQTLTTLSDDPADLFSQLWDQLYADQFESVDVYTWLTDERIDDLSGYIEETVLNEGRFVAGRIAELIESADELDERIFAIMLGLDRALIHVNSFLGSFDQGALVSLATRYAETGRLNTDRVDGALLPRCAFPGRPRAAPNTVADAFISVVRVDEESWGRTSHIQIPARFDFSRTTRDQGLRVACVPFLEEPDDVEIVSAERSGRRVFRIAPANSERLLQRADELLSLLDESGAQLAVLPELSLSKNLLDHWRTTLASNPAPPLSELRWVFAGTGNVSLVDPPVNRGVLLDRRSGEILLTQDKVFPFTLSQEQLLEWGLSTHLGDSEIDEDLAAGSQITVAETRLGRLTILVCEDLGRTFDHGPSLRAHGISHSLAPVFSKPVQRHHWEHVKAKEYATETGTATIVSNSLVVARLMGEASAAGTSLVHSPAQTEFGVAESATDVVLFSVERQFYRDDSDA